MFVEINNRIHPAPNLLKADNPGQQVGMNISYGRHNRSRMLVSILWSQTSVAQNPVIENFKLTHYPVLKNLDFRFLFAYSAGR